jgi:hypothetical protein
VIDAKAILADIDAALGEYAALRKKSQYDDCSDQDDVVVAAMNTRLAAAIERYSEPSSRYAKSLQQSIGKHRPDSPLTLASLVGVLQALHGDIAAGRLATITELIHADVFGDFLDMADHLLQEGYKDPAAVLAGGVLEEHLRQLCAKHGLPTISATGGPKKADAMNADLAKVPAYSKLDQKNITAWQALRNDAAHGKYGAYKAEQVALLLQSIRDFITRVPA